MCLCGMLAAEYATLPSTMQDGVHYFFDAHGAWLVEVMMTGRTHKQLALNGAPAGAARLLVLALEGAMLLARSRWGSVQLRSVVTNSLNGLGASPADAAQASRLSLQRRGSAAQ